jgi:hypothetical protein
MQTKEIETLSFMVEFQDARINKLADELKAEKSFNKALQSDNDRLHDLLDNSEDNVKRVSLLMSNLRLKDALC